MSACNPYLPGAPDCGLMVLPAGTTNPYLPDWLLFAQFGPRPQEQAIDLVTDVPTPPSVEDEFAVILGVPSVEWGTAHAAAVEPVPEPSAGALLLTAVLLAALWKVSR